MRRCALQQQMESQRVPEFVRQKMVKYYSHLWSYNKAVSAKSLFVDLPDPMRAEISLAVTWRMWSKVGSIREEKPPEYFRSPLFLEFRDEWRIDDLWAVAPGRI